MHTRERTSFGGPGDFMTVRHLVLRGTNFEIGRALGAIAVERYGRTPADLAAPALYVRARRRYAQTAFPLHWQRMRGVADAFGLDPEDDRYDLTGLPLHIDFAPTFGCSVVYYPPSTTASGAGQLSRNYDFFIRSMPELFGMAPKAGEKAAPAVMSEPYVMQWHPTDGGHASVAIQAFDMLAGTLDGINDAGLVVSILADDESLRQLGPHWEPHLGPQRAVGLHELAVMRLLLDTCATVDEARDALMNVKQYYRFVPCRYMVADRGGRSFVYENSIGRNVQHVIEGTAAAPHVVTNFQLSKHPEGEPVPASLTLENEYFWRYRVLCDAVAGRTGFTPDAIRAINGRVCTERGILALAGAPSRTAAVAASMPARTVWHSLYDQEARTLEASFYLGDQPRPDGAHAERRSDYLKIALGEA